MNRCTLLAMLGLLSLLLSGCCCGSGGCGGCGTGCSPCGGAPVNYGYGAPPASPTYVVPQNGAAYVQ